MDLPFAKKIVAVAAAGLLASLLSTLTLAAPAQAAPPVVAPDTADIYAGTFVAPDLLANDSDPDGDPLEVCRLQEVLEGPVVFGELDGLPVVFAEPGTTGTFTFTYYACDFETLVPGTLTVNVKASPRMRVKVVKLRRPGKLRVVNRNPFPVVFAWGHAREEEPDAVVRIAKRKARVITVRRTAITWVAFNLANGSQKVGYTKRIRLPEGTDALPPSPHPGRVEARPDLRGLLHDLGWLAPGGIRR